MLTKNTDKLRREVAVHVAADTIIQGTYWDTDNWRGCFIGCLAHANDPDYDSYEYATEPIPYDTTWAQTAQAKAPDNGRMEGTL